MSQGEIYQGSGTISPGRPPPHLHYSRPHTFQLEKKQLCWNSQAKPKGSSGKNFYCPLYLKNDSTEVTLESNLKTCEPSITDTWNNKKHFLNKTKVFLKCEFSLYLSTPNEIPYKLFMIEKLKTWGKMKLFKFVHFLIFVLEQSVLFPHSYNSQSCKNFSLVWYKIFLNNIYSFKLLYHERSKYPSMWNVVLVNILYTHLWI